MSRTKVPPTTVPPDSTSIDLSDRDGILRFMDGPARAGADEIVQFVGPLNVNDDNFSAVICDLVEQVEGDEGDEVEPFIRQLQAEGGERLKLALKIDAAHNSCMMDRTHLGYLIGLAVGLRMGGAR